MYLIKQWDNPSVLVTHDPWSNCFRGAETLEAWKTQQNHVAWSWDFERLNLRVSWVWTFQKGSLILVTCSCTPSGWILMTLGPWAYTLRFKHATLICREIDFEFQTWYLWFYVYLTRLRLWTFGGKASFRPSTRRYDRPQTSKINVNEPNNDDSFADEL
jgi:hypothetical protein